MNLLVTLNEEMNVALKIIKYPEEFGLLFGLIMLLDTLSASSLGNMLKGKPKISGKEVVRVSERIIWASQGTIRADDNF